VSSADRRSKITVLNEIRPVAGLSDASFPFRGGLDGKAIDQVRAQRRMIGLWIAADDIASEGGIVGIGREVGHL
jgi:hypothetical protein